MNEPFPIDEVKDAIRVMEEAEVYIDALEREVGSLRNVNARLERELLQRETELIEQEGEQKDEQG